MSDTTAPPEFEGRISKEKDWREIVAWVGDLPPMPQVASRALGMVENPDTTAQELADLLSTDTALAARVLKIANSAMFSRQREITTIGQAVMIIGFKALKGIIVAATLRQMNKRFGEADKLIWENSMATAMCATQIAKSLKKPFVDEIFLLGLLHSLGQIVLLTQSETEKDYQQVLKSIEDRHTTYSETEQELLGFAHPLIGALVAKKWNFSADTCQVILHYADPIDGIDSELEQKTAIVQLADAISHAAGIGSPAGYPDQMEKIELLVKLLGFPGESAEVIEGLINSTKDQFEQEGSIYS